MDYKVKKVVVFIMLGTLFFMGGCKKQKTEETVSNPEQTVSMSELDREIQERIDKGEGIFNKFDDLRYALAEVTDQLGDKDLSVKFNDDYELITISDTGKELKSYMNKYEKLMQTKESSAEDLKILEEARDFVNNYNDLAKKIYKDVDQNHRIVLLNPLETDKTLVIWSEGEQIYNIFEDLLKEP